MDNNAKQKLSNEAVYTTEKSDSPGLLATPQRIKRRLEKAKILKRKKHISVTSSTESLGDNFYSLVEKNLSSNKSKLDKQTMDNIVCPQEDSFTDPITSACADVKCHKESTIIDSFVERGAKDNPGGKLPYAVKCNKATITTADVFTPTAELMPENYKTPEQENRFAGGSNRGNPDNSFFARDALFKCERYQGNDAWSPENKGDIKTTAFKTMVRELVGDIIVNALKQYDPSNRAPNKEKQEIIEPSKNDKSEHNKLLENSMGLKNEIPKTELNKNEVPASSFSKVSTQTCLVEPSLVKVPKGSVILFSGSQLEIDSSVNKELNVSKYTSQSKIGKSEIEVCCKTTDHSQKPDGRNGTKSTQEISLQESMVGTENNLGEECDTTIEGAENVQSYLKKDEKLLRKRNKQTFPRSSTTEVNKDIKDAELTTGPDTTYATRTAFYQQSETIKEIVEQKGKANKYSNLLEKPLPEKTVDKCVKEGKADMRLDNFSGIDETSPVGATAKNHIRPEHVFVKDETCPVGGPEKDHIRPEHVFVRDETSSVGGPEKDNIRLEHAVVREETSIVYSPMKDDVRQDHIPIRKDTNPDDGPEKDLKKLDHIPVIKNRIPDGATGKDNISPEHVLVRDKTSRVDVPEKDHITKDNTVVSDNRIPVGATGKDNISPENVCVRDEKSLVSGSGKDDIPDDLSERDNRRPVIGSGEDKKKTDDLPVDLSIRNNSTSVGVSKTDNLTQDDLCVSQDITFEFSEDIFSKDLRDRIRKERTPTFVNIPRFQTAHFSMNRLIPSTTIKTEKVNPSQRVAVVKGRTSNSKQNILPKETKNNQSKEVSTNDRATENTRKSFHRRTMSDVPERKRWIEDVKDGNANNEQGVSTGLPHLHRSFSSDSSSTQTFYCNCTNGNPVVTEVRLN